MQYVVLIYETPKDFESRGGDRNHPYIAAWRAYHKALVAAGVYVGGAPLQDVGTATTVESHVYQSGGARANNGVHDNMREEP